MNPDSVLPFLGFKLPEKAQTHGNEAAKEVFIGKVDTAKSTLKNMQHWG